MGAVDLICFKPYKGKSKCVCSTFPSVGNAVSNPIRESQNKATVKENHRTASFKPYKGKSKYYRRLSL